MTSLPDAIRQVLVKHGVYINRDSKSNVGMLIADLAALYPVMPSRKALEKILRRWVASHALGYPGMEKKWFEIKVNEIMDWASGQRTMRKWCEHVQYEKRGGVGYAGYYLQNNHGINILVDENWQQCPICGTPRPVEG